MRLPLLVALLAAAALAQGSGGGRPKPAFAEPEGAPAPAEAAAGPAREGDELRALLERLRGWPNESARRAAERLIVRKEASAEAVLRVLASTRKEDAPLKPGAAYVYGHVGDPERAVLLVVAAAEPEQKNHGSVFLEAAFRLNPELAVDEAFRFFSLSATTLRRQAAAFVRERVSARNLPQVLALLDRKRAPQGFTREIGLDLLDRLVATGQVKPEEAAEHFYAALGDPSPSVARSAMLRLASRNDPENIRRLNEIVAGPRSDWRDRSYAAMALGLLAQAFREQPFTPEALAALRGELGLGHRKEMLPRAAAALALAQAALRSGDPELARLLDREIPIVLIDSVGGGGRHFLDFASVQPLAFAMLRRITGQTFPDQAPLWATWWRDNGERFRARRELVAVGEKDLDELVLDATLPDGGGSVRLQAVGDAPPASRPVPAFAVPRKEMAALVKQLEEAGFFRAGARDGEPDAGSVRVALRVGNLARVADLERAAGGARIADEVGRLAREYAWQRWWDAHAQPSWALFFAENARWFQERRDERERAERLRAMVAAALPGLVAIEDRLEALDAVRALSGGVAALAPEHVRAFVGAVAMETEANRFVEAVVDAFAREGRDDMREALVDAVAGKVGPEAHALLVKLFRSLGAERVRALASDARWKVRRAATSALAAMDPQGARPVLLERLRDEETLVRLAAVEALARSKDERALEALQHLANDPSPSIRAEAAYAYGLLGAKDAEGRIAQLLYEDPEVDVRVRAVEGLADGGDPSAAERLVSVFRSERDVRVRAAAADALVRLESPALVDHLVRQIELTVAASPERVALVNVLARFRSDRTVETLRRLLAGDDEASRDAAALGLARRWDAAALPQLVSMLQRGRNARTALMHLQLLTSCAFQTESFEEQARNYEAWAAANADGNPRTWFRDALAVANYDVAPLAAWAQGEALPDEAVPLLLRVLRDPEWYLARNASMLLRQRLGPGAPDELTYLTTDEEREAAIRAFHDAWAAESAGKRDEAR
jgi:HEAT repeat protein